MKLPFLVKQLALLVMVLSGIMLLVAGWGLLQVALGVEHEHDATQAMLISSATAGIFGGVLWLLTRRRAGFLDRRQALLLVVLSWVIAALLGAMPYLLWNQLSNDPLHVFRSPAACLFESTSGLTTTGATTLADIDGMPRVLLLWRATTHWLGGLGIVVLFVAVLPSLGVGGRRLFGTETTASQPGGIHPQIRDTARVLWYIYTGLTLVLIAVLRFAGMSYFDAVCHAFSTMATGGYSTRDASLGEYSGTIQVVVIGFMILGGVNFGIYHALLRKRFREVWRDPELRVYLAILGVSSLLVAFWIYGSTLTTTTGDRVDATAGVAIREAAFSVTSIMTTTGFGTSDFDAWPSIAKFLVVMLMFVGGSAGSTSGGIKVIRVWIAFKVLLHEVERVYRPHIVRPVRLGGRALDEQQRNAAIIYIVGMLFLFIIGAFAVLMLEGGEADITTAATASIASLCTIGPGLGRIGPLSNFGWMEDSTLTVLSILMLVGRLEVLPVLVLFVPSYWRGE